MIAALEVAQPLCDSLPGPNALPPFLRSHYEGCVSTLTYDAGADLLELHLANPESGVTWSDPHCCFHWIGNSQEWGYN